MKHGCSDQKRNPEYQAWHNMRSRCLNQRHPSYHRYGGRGINIAPEWDDFSVFINDMGRRPAGYSLERDDVNDGYHKDNCRWIPRNDQQRNRERSPRALWLGSVWLVADIAGAVGIPGNRLNDHMSRHPNIEDAIESAKGTMIQSASLVWPGWRSHHWRRVRKQEIQQVA